MRQTSDRHRITYPVRTADISAWRSKMPISARTPNCEASIAIVFVSDGRKVVCPIKTESDYLV